MLKLPTTVIGTKSRGKVMPIITPKLAIASLDEKPDNINIFGIKRDVRGWTSEFATRIPVIGNELFIKLLYSPRLKISLSPFLK